MFKKAFIGEGMSLMKVSGSGDVFLAQDADELFLDTGVRGGPEPDSMTPERTAGFTIPEP